jgi:hypothetical protein
MSPHRLNKKVPNNFIGRFINSDMKVPTLKIIQTSFQNYFISSLKSIVDDY